MSRYRHRLIYTAVLSCTCITALRAVPLENWRHPFYSLAAERGDFIQSPSGLFWDDLTYPAVFHSSLWPDTASYAADHWLLEPSLGLAASNSEFPTGKKTNLHFDLLSDVRYRNLTVRNALDVDQSYKSHPGYTWHKERIAAGRIEEAYAQYGRKRWFVRFGRMNRCWGPMPDRSFVLSNNPFSYDALEWQVAAPFFEFRHLIAAFPLHGSEIDTRGLQLNRYFCAHSLKFIFGKWAAAGVTETTVFGRKDGLPDFQYINPFSIYAVINTNQEAASWGQGTGNLMLSFDARVHPFIENVLLWGQVAIDDFQVDDASPLDQEPTHWGVDAGASWADPFPALPPHHVAIRYRYLSKWMYTVMEGNTLLGERYTYLGRSLGFESIDGDEIEVSATAIGRNWWAARWGVGVARQDTVTVATPWPIDPATGTLGYRTETPLSQRSHVETLIFARLTGHAYFRDYAALSVSFDNRFVRNKNNVINDGFEYDPVISITLTGHYSGIFVRFK